MRGIRTTATALRARVARTLLAAAFALLAAAAPAAANSNGGAQSPSAPLSGGSQYGVLKASAVPHPVVTSLTTPSTAVPGRPPRVTYRIDEPGETRVDLTVAVHDLTTRRAAVVAQMGWVRTARTTAVVWPHGATLAPGSYHVSVSAHDRYNHNLTRTAHSSGVATLTVAAPAPSPAPAPAPSPAAPALEAGVPTPAQTVADGAVFPVQGAHNFGGPENRYGAPRSGYFHEGQDVLTAEGTPDVAPLGGTISSTNYQASGAGYYAVEHTTIGFDFMFAHCKAASLAVSAGQAVSPGSPICLAGQTGDATAPHLHFEMWVDGWHESSASHSIDPLPYLEAWEHAA
ncbi:MAG TPA: M23 family metallopeptidase [Solirubrobacteraceae bacterium]|nr:M23 family metallopeptidase [Solirubrobacteraceae bacterium]